MNDVYIFVGVLIAVFIGIAHMLLILEKVKVLNNEDVRDQEAHEERMNAQVYRH